MHILQFLFLMMFNFLRQLFVPKCPTMEKEKKINVFPPCLISLIGVRQGGGGETKIPFGQPASQALLFRSSPTLHSVGQFRLPFRARPPPPPTGCCSSRRWPPGKRPPRGRAPGRSPSAAQPAAAPCCPQPPCFPPACASAASPKPPHGPTWVVCQRETPRQRTPTFRADPVSCLEQPSRLCPRNFHFYV